MSVWVVGERAKRKDETDRARVKVNDGAKSKLERGGKIEIQVHSCLSKKKKMVKLCVM